MNHHRLAVSAFGVESDITRLKRVENISTIVQLICLYTLEKRICCKYIFSFYEKRKYIYASVVETEERTVNENI